MVTVRRIQVYVCVGPMHLSSQLKYTSKSRLGKLTDQTVVDSLLLCYFILIINCDNKLILFVMFSIFFLILLPSLTNFRLRDFGLWGFSGLGILEWFSTWNIKHSTTPIHVDFQRNNSCLFVFSKSYCHSYLVLVVFLRII